MPSRPLSATPELVLPARSLSAQPALQERRTPMASTAAPVAETLTAAEAAKILKMSESWLAKARMRGDGPAFMKVGRSVRHVHCIVPAPVVLMRASVELRHAAYFTIRVWGAASSIVRRACIRMMG
jgi:hypothetical protein